MERMLWYWKIWCIIYCLRIEFSTQLDFNVSTRIYNEFLHRFNIIETNIYPPVNTVKKKEKQTNWGRFVITIQKYCNYILKTFIYLHLYLISRLTCVVWNSTIIKLNNGKMNAQIKIKKTTWNWFTNQMKNKWYVNIDDFYIN